MSAKQESIDAIRTQLAESARQSSASLDREQRAAIEQRIVEAIVRLRPPIRRVFLLHHIHRKTRAETAQWLGISRRRVDKRLTKGLRQVMNWVGPGSFAPYVWDRLLRTNLSSCFYCARCIPAPGEIERKHRDDRLGRDVSFEPISYPTVPICASTQLINKSPGRLIR